MVQDKSNQRTSPQSRELQSALLQGTPVAAYCPAPVCWAAVHYTQQTLCPCSCELSQSITSSAEHGMDRVQYTWTGGENLRTGPAEQHQLPLQVRQTANNSKPTICSGQTKQVYNSVGACSAVTQVSPKPASSCIHFLHENLKGFWRILQFLVKRTAGGGYAASGQAFKSCKQASAPT